MMMTTKTKRRAAGEDEDGNKWIRIGAMTRDEAKQRFSSKAKVNKKRASEHKKAHYGVIFAACRAFGNSGPFGAGSLKQNRAFFVRELSGWTANTPSDETPAPAMAVAPTEEVRFSESKSKKERKTKPRFVIGSKYKSPGF